MKILITNDDKTVVVAKDFSDLTKNDLGLIGQLVAELELIKRELLFIYDGDVE